MSGTLRGVAICAVLVGAALAAGNFFVAQAAGYLEDMTITISTKLSSARPAPIAAPAGSDITITLPSNPGTGYSWRIANKPTAGVVKHVGNVFNPPEKPMPGRPGTETWTFKAVGKGTSTIAMEYIRPFETNAKPAKTQSFSVTVR